MIMSGRKLDPAKRTAIIYSNDELFYYTVEIRHYDRSYFIGNENTPEIFGNLDNVRRACSEHKVEAGFLALSKTYHEFTPITETLSCMLDRYEYVPFVLEVKK
jgi:hypothetical protein